MQSAPKKEEKKGQLFSTVKPTSKAVIEKPTSTAKLTSSAASPSDDDDLLIIEASPLADKHKCQQKTRDKLKKSASVKNQSLKSASGKCEEILIRDDKSFKPSDTVTCIPETQICNSVNNSHVPDKEGPVQPNFSAARGFSSKCVPVEKTNTKGAFKEYKNDAEILDDTIIPDTPDPLSKLVRKKRPPGRSFLSSSSFLKMAHHGPVEKVMAGQSHKPGAFNKGRNFDEAYKEMQNAKHGDKGTLAGGNEEGMARIMEVMGLSDLSVKPKPSPALSDGVDTPPTVEEPPAASKLLSALGPNEQTEKKGCVIAKVGGVKRPSSGGVSPNPKRSSNEQKHEMKPTGNAKRSVNEIQNAKHTKKSNCKLSRDIDNNNKHEETACKKTDSWESHVKVCENDDLLLGILSEMKVPDTPVIAKADTNEQKSKMPLQVIEANSPESPAVGMATDVDADAALDDIIAELQSTLPSNASYIESEGVLDHSMEQHKRLSFSSDDDAVLQAAAAAHSDDPPRTRPHSTPVKER